MVEGKTLLVLLLLGRCQHSATVPQPAKKGTAFDHKEKKAACVQQWAQMPRPGS